MIRLVMHNSIILGLFMLRLVNYLLTECLIWCIKNSMNHIISKNKLFIYKNICDIQRV